MGKVVLSDLISEIKKRGLTAYEISKDTPLSEDGINKILRGDSKNPRQTTLLILHDYLFGTPDRKSEELNVIGEEKTPYNSMESLLAKRVLEELKPFIEKSLVSRQELIKLVQATALKVAENNIKMQEMEVVLKEMDKKISLLLSE